MSSNLRRGWRFRPRGEAPGAILAEQTSDEDRIRHEANRRETAGCRLEAEPRPLAEGPEQGLL